MSLEAREFIRAALEDRARAADVPAAALPVVLGQLAELQAVFLARLVSNGNGHAAPPTPSAPPETERLLTAEQAAELLGVAPRWLYRHADQIPGARRLSRKCLRFTEAGLRRYLANARR
ncbi:MAG TPA: helix-turn-helix domain-containing protein [Verrucomicrobiae bacterium]|nr:helix-turn-helix domain-containing protein [Verrucomicrobiae bacterium]